MQGRAECIGEFTRGFSEGALHRPIPAEHSPAFVDGYAHGRLSLRAALVEYLRERGFNDLKDQPLERFLGGP